MALRGAAGHSASEEAPRNTFRPPPRLKEPATQVARDEPESSATHEVRHLSNDSSENPDPVVLDVVTAASDEDENAHEDHEEASSPSKQPPPVPLQLPKASASGTSQEKTSPSQPKRLPPGPSTLTTPLSSTEKESTSPTRPLRLPPSPAKQAETPKDADTCDVELSMEVPAIDAALDDFSVFIGFWFRKSDGVFMAQIKEDRMLHWAMSFGGTKLPLRWTPPCLSMELAEESYVGSAAYSEIPAGLLWSDGELWVQGMRPFEGVWKSEADGKEIAAIAGDGSLSWRSEFASMHPLRLRLLSLGGSQGIELALDAAQIVSAELSEGGNRLTWSDGDVWIRC